MCGLAGLLVRGEGSEHVESRAAAMIRTLVHRGPDDSGIWCDPGCGVALGFRRLAIIDLSAEGHQPMVSASGRFVMVFNGEVYNHEALRGRLTAAGVTFRGHSDTEVMLAAIECWGLREAVSSFIGMFAIALWDRQERELTLLRDRLGIKPLYYQLTPGGILFGSELKALAADPRFDRRLDPDAISAYLRYLYVPAPASIYAGTRKLLPGHLLTVPLSGDPPPSSESYWSLEAVADAGLAKPDTGAESEIVERLDSILRDAVLLRMQADVPLGALLSGGIDSSLVVSLMQAQSATPVRTYTIGFDDPAYDEGSLAHGVATCLGTDHTALHLTGEDALKVIPLLPEMFDEPLADPSQIPTYLVSRLARQDVTVALSGDGGDELFGGYNRYIYGERLIPRAAQWPWLGRRAVAAGLRRAPYGMLDGLGSLISRVARSDGTAHHVAGKLRKIGHLLGEKSPEGMYRSLLAAWQAPEEVLRIRGTRAESRSLQDRDLGLLEAMLLADQGSYLPDDLLGKVDRASMAVSLEVRVPLLDHRVVEFAWRLPRDLKIRDGVGKYILRRVLDRYVPPALVNRPKMGFSVPVASWLRGPLRAWARDLLDPERLHRDGLFRAAQVSDAWNRFIHGDDSVALGLWAVLMFQAWRDRWLPAGAIDHVRAGEAA